MFMSPALVTTVLPFLNGEQEPPVWTATPTNQETGKHGK